MNAESWTREEAENYAAVYASLHNELLKQQAEDERLKGQLKRWLELNDVSELVDGETGLGVELGPPRTETTWDTKSMADNVILGLRDRGLLTIASNTAFDALRKAGGGTDLDDAARYRMRGEGSRPLKVVVK